MEYSALANEFVRKDYMPKRFYFRKLVRDNIVQNCLDDPKVLEVSFRTLDDEEYKTELVKKISEEASEIPISKNAERHEVLAEIADLQKVVDSIRDIYGFTDAEVSKEGASKTDKKGGFAKKHYVDYVTLADDSSWIDIFRSQPDKYLEEETSTVGAVAVESPEKLQHQVIKGVYRHTKTGKMYEVIGAALHTETEELLVVYRPLYETSYELFARPVKMFFETVELDGKNVPRFEKIDKSSV